MDAQKTGLFICLLRKQKGLTQSQLAQQIGVTDKAVSRWETGKGFPDVGLLEPLAAALDTSVSELMAGEPLTAEEKAEKSDSAILEALRYTKSMGGKTISVLLMIAGSFLLASPLFTAGFSPALPLIGLFLLIISLLLRFGKFSFRLPPLFQNISPKSARIGSLACLTAALVLELLPWGAVLRFAWPDEVTGQLVYSYNTYSYFSLTPFGYANFAPLLTGILTVLLFLLSLLQFKRHSERLGNNLFITNIVAVVFSILPAVFFSFDHFFDHFSLVGGLITLCLLISTGFIALANREN